MKKIIILALIASMLVGCSNLTETRPEIEPDASVGFMGDDSDVEKGEYKVEVFVEPAPTYETDGLSDESTLVIYVKTKKDYVPDADWITDKTIDVAIANADESINFTLENKYKTVHDEEIIIWSYFYDLKDMTDIDLVAVTVGTDTGDETSIFEFN